MGRGILRSAVAVVSGWIVVTGGYILTSAVFGLFNPDTFTPAVPLPAGWLLVTLVASAIWSVIAGFVTAVFAQRREVGHAIALVLLSLIVSLYFVSTNENLGQVPAWYMIAGEVLTSVAILVGGWLRKNQRILLGRLSKGATGTVASISLAADRWWFLIAVVVTFITFLACFWALVLGAGQGLLW